MNIYPKRKSVKGIFLFFGFFLSFFCFCGGRLFCCREGAREWQVPQRSRRAAFTPALRLAQGPIFGWARGSWRSWMAFFVLDGGSCGLICGRRWRGGRVPVPAGGRSATRGMEPGGGTPQAPHTRPRCSFMEHLYYQESAAKRERELRRRDGFILGILRFRLR